MSSSINRSRLLFSATSSAVILLSFATAGAQSSDASKGGTKTRAPSNDPTPSFWYNPGNGATPGFDPALGEFHDDIGGYLEFARYMAGHPYFNIRGDIERNFFDPAAMEALLGTLQDPVIEPKSSGSYSVYYLDHDVSYETMILNGAPLSLIWDPTALLPNPQLFIELKPGNGPHSGPQQFVFVGGDYEPDHGRSAPSTDFPGKPLAPPEQSVAQGHYLAILTPNRWPDMWVAFQRTVDAIRYLEDRPDVSFENAYIHGGSWEGNQACHAALFAPELVRGAIGPFLLDLGFEMPPGGWNKILKSYYASLGKGSEGTSIPPRTHSIQGFVFGFPSLRAADLHTGWELAAYSPLQRRSLIATDRLQRPLHWYIGNCDIFHNVHFYLDLLKNDPALAPYTSQIGSLQLLGHGGEGAGPLNHQFFYDGTEIADLFADPTSLGPATNPTINPGPSLAPADPYFVDIYAHTVLDIPESNPWSHPSLQAPLLEGLSWDPSFPVEEPATLGPIGNGVYPGAFDSLRIGDFDGDAKNEVVFGNLEGFVEILEERFYGSPPEPVLVPEYRSPNLGWNIQALDVGTLSGGNSWIVVGTGSGTLAKIKIRPPTDMNGRASYGDPVELLDPSVAAENRPPAGYTSWLTLADFDPRSHGNEILVQDEFAIWYLYTASGQFLAKSIRGVDTQGRPDAFDPGSGKPWVGSWSRSASAGVHAYLPGNDGRLRRLTYDGTARLNIDVVSDDYYAMGRCALKWDPPGPFGPYIVVGGLPGDGPDPVDPQDDGHIITVIDPDAAPGSNILGGFSGDGITTLLEVAVLEPYAPNEFLALNRDTVTRIQVDIDGQGNITFGFPAGATDRRIPAGQAELCALEPYLSGGTDRFLVLAPNGRIWALNHDDLSIARTTDTLERAPNTDPYPWCSNRTFGHAFTTDQRLDATQAIWIDDLGIPYQNDGGAEQSRVARLDPLDGVIEDWFLVGRGSTDLLGMTIDQNSGTRFYFVENGAIGTVGAQNYRYTLIGPVEPRAGYIQQLGSTLSILENFDVPVDAVTHEAFTNSQNETTHWPYAEEPRYHGQVTAAVRPGQRPFGNTVQTAMLRKSPQDDPETHVVVGTLGGYVYAVDPDDPVDGLTFYTEEDLGWAVIGMDIGNIDEDERQEIVVGTWLDTASMDDQGDVTKHRGHLYILEMTSKGAFDVQEIEITTPDRFGAAVFGVKIDDINGDGQNELWVTDGRGYLHALRRVGGSWECFYRTEGLGLYAGMYNKIWPYKDGQGKTTRLVVQTPGYVHRFAVSPEVVDD